MPPLSTKILATFGSCVLAFSVPGENFTIQSADTLSTLGRDWVKNYTQQHLEARIEIKAVSTAASFQALCKKETQMILVPRSIRYPELQACEKALGGHPTEYKVAVNGVAVYVEPSNQVKELTYDELVKVFSGRCVDWKDVGGAPGPITVLAPEVSSGIRELFIEEVMNGKAFSARVQTMRMNELFTAVAKDKRALGFGALVQDQGVRALAIKRAYSSTPVEPSKETISGRIYPIARFVFCYTPASATEAKAFLDWIRGDEGQEIAAKAGFYGLAAKWRLKP